MAKNMPACAVGYAVLQNPHAHFILVALYLLSAKTFQIYPYLPPPLSLSPKQSEERNLVPLRCRSFSSFPSSGSIQTSN
jgi:hypothetical protein